MSLPHTPLRSSDAALLTMLLAALREHEGRRRKHPRHAFIALFQSHPALSVACPDPAFVYELTAHPLYCLASRSSVQRWEVMFRCRAPSQIQEQQWNVYDIDIGLKQRSTLLARAALCELLVLRLMRFRSACRVRHLLHHATCVVSRRHFLVSKNLADGLFQEGQRLWQCPSQHRFSDAAKSWGQAALLRHAASHAFLSSMLFCGRHDVAKDEKRAFELAAAGAAMGCAHSKGMLGDCLVEGAGVAKDVGKGLALARESAAAGSCFGQFVVGKCYNRGWGVVRDYAEAARLYRLSAEQGYACAQWDLGCMVQFGKAPGVARDCAEAVRLYRLAAAQGDVNAQVNLAIMFQEGSQVTQDYEEAARLYRLAAAQGDEHAQMSLGYFFREGTGVAQDYAEAVRLYRLAAARGTRGTGGYAELSLGEMFHHGEGVAKDRAEAIRWYRLAAANFCPEAAAALKDIGA
jgi:TPR repeat protein